MDSYFKYNDNDEFKAYERFIVDVLDRINILYTDQMIYMIMREFGDRATYDDAVKAVFNAQRHGQALLSDNGFIMKKTAYQEVVDDPFYDKLIKGKPERIDGKLINLKYFAHDLQTIDCMWVVADMLPGADKFVIGESPWLIKFIMPADDNHEARVFEITKFKSGEEMADGIFLDSLPKLGRNPETVNLLRRVVVLDDERAVGTVPKGCGVSLITVLDDSQPNNLRILQSFSPEESWRKK